MRITINKLIIFTVLIFCISNCTYWPVASIYIKDHFFKTLRPNSLNLLASLFLLPSSIDTTPGAKIELTSNNSFKATWIDVSGDGISDGIDLTGDGIPNILALDLNSDGKPDSLDTSGDGNPNYFLNISTNGGTLRTSANGSGNPVFLILSTTREILGFDTDNDGTPNDTNIVMILKDVTPPVISLNLASGVYSNGTEITFNCSDDKAPSHVIYTLDSSIPRFSPLNGIVNHPASAKSKLVNNGVYSVNAFCRDLAGNVSNYLVKVYTIDPNLPNLVIVSQSSKGVSSNPGAISQSTTKWKSSKSGNYSIRGSSTSCSDGIILASGSTISDTENIFLRNATDFVAEGASFYRICFVSDQGFNAETNFTVYRDDTAPILSVSVGSGNYGSQPLPTIICSDTGGSGCNGIVYSLDAIGIAADPVFDPITGLITTGISYGLTAITMTNFATNTLKFQARDSAGNLSLINLQTYVLDSSLPTLTINSVTSYVKGTSYPIIKFQSSKEGTYQIMLGGTDCTNGTAFPSSVPNFAVAGSAIVNATKTVQMDKALFAEGDNSVRICFTTIFGVDGSIALTIHKDSAIPVVSILSPTGPGPHPSGTTISLQCTDTGGSGCKNIGYYTSDDGGSVFLNTITGLVTSGSLYSTPFSLPDGLYTITYRANDLALNQSNLHTLTIQIGIPGSPNYIKTTAYNTTIALEWLPTSSSTSYSLYYSTSPGVNASSSRIDGITDVFYNLSGLIPNTTYYFKLQSHSALGASPLSSYESTAHTSSTPMGLNALGSYVDVSAGQGGNSGIYPVSRIDYTNKKILTSTWNFANGAQPNIYICNLDGTNCVYRDISAGQASATSLNPTLEIDTKNQKLLVASANSGNFNHTSLYRCDLDGSNCVHNDISGGTGATFNTNLILDSVYNKIIVISRSSNFSFASSICNIDGTNCFGSIPNVPGLSGAYVAEIKATMDPINQKILIVTRNNGNGDRLTLIRCSLKVKNCTFTDVSAGQGVGSGFFPQIYVDVKNAKLILTSRNVDTGGQLSFYRCDLDGTNCTHQTISSGIIIAPETHSASIDTVTGKLLVAVRDNSNGRANLIRCDLDGSNATTTDISNGIDSSGYTPSLVIDSINGWIAVITKNLTNGSRLGMFLR